MFHYSHGYPHHYHVPSKKRGLLICLALAAFYLAIVPIHFTFTSQPLFQAELQALFTVSMSEFVQNRTQGLPFKESDISSFRTDAAKWVPAKDGDAVYTTEKRTSKRSLMNNTSKQHAPHYHTVFSTSCLPQQNWESYVFFYHAMKVGQPGTITRIASGCSETEEMRLRAFHKRFIVTMSPNFRIHFTPGYDNLHLANGKPYKYMNKPYGLRHWMEHELGLSNETYASAPNDVLDRIVILMDPDMILLRPLRHDLRDENVVWVEDEPATKVVRHGYPIAQQDGYLTNQWMELPINYTRVPERDGPIHWNSGPPYLATVLDTYKLTLGWTRWVHNVLDVYPKLFAEMYGLIFASVELQLPFTFIQAIVVSSTITLRREGWKYIDQLQDNELCNVPPKRSMPIGLHYCQRYVLGMNFFSKYRVKKNIMDCEKALLKPPPKDVWPRYNYSVLPPRADGKDKNTWKEERLLIQRKVVAKREAFMLCAMIDKVNEALRYFKGRACDGDANLKETYTVYDDPSFT